jgi:acetolactate synthase-1/2/3 large subunit
VAGPLPTAGHPLAARLANCLAAAGSTALFGLPGGEPNLDVVGAAADRGMRFVLAHGETAAAIMAAAHGLLTGRPTAVVAPDLIFGLHGPGE